MNVPWCVRQSIGRWSILLRTNWHATDTGVEAGKEATEDTGAGEVGMGGTVAGEGTDRTIGTMDMAAVSIGLTATGIPTGTAIPVMGSRIGTAIRRTIMVDSAT